MTNRPKNSWDDFKTVGTAQDYKRPPTLGDRIFVAFGSLVIGLIYGFIGSHLMLFTFNAITLRRGFGFFYTPPWVYTVMVLFAFGWAIYQWIMGLREEQETRGRLERHQARSEKIARLQTKRIQREMQAEPEDEEE